MRRSLKDRLKRAAAGSGREITQLQRELAYDRFLQRLYLLDTRWIIKGATALIARRLGVRSTRDIDIYRSSTSREAEADLRRAIAIEVDDGFRFELGSSQPVGDGAGVSLSIDAYVGATLWAQFHVDLVGADLRMTGEPEGVPPLTPLEMPNLAQADYLAYPLVDHVADKVAAILERHGEGNYASTRYKDLVDLVSIVSGASVDAEKQIVAIRSEFNRRNIRLPGSFAVPDTADWGRGYAREARQLGPELPRRLADAVTFVATFLDPVFSGAAQGTWNPALCTWVEPR